MIITNIIGRPVSQSGVIVGYTLCVAGPVLLVVQNFIIGPVLLLMGLFMAGTTEGTQLDVEGKRVRSFLAVLGIKKGTWESLDQYPFLSVLRKNKGQTQGIPNTTAADVTFHFVQYEICLLSESHRKRLLVKIHDKKEAAQADAATLSALLGKPLVEFSPKRIVQGRR